MHPSDCAPSPPARAQLEAGVQRRMFWFGACFAAALAPMYLGLSLVQGALLRAAVQAALFTAVFATMLWVLRSRDHRRGLRLLHAATFCGVLAGALVEPGTQSPWFWWLSVMPIVAVLSGATAMGVAQGLVVVGYAVAAWTLPIEPAPHDALRLLLAKALSTVYACTYVALVLSWQRGLERALDAARDDETEAARARTRFLANLGHEIRTPLGGLISTIELMKAPGTGAAERETLVAMQAQSAQALLALVDDVLDWCKLDAGRMKLAEAPVDLAALLWDIAEMFAVQAFRKGIDITASVEPGMPTRFRGDAKRLRQVLSNLAGNAVKFTEQGGVHLHLSADAASGGVCIEVADTAIGLTAEQAARLFRPFAQADASISRRFGGTGLGLAISHELVRCMGGRIELRSAPALGSSFTVVLPLCSAATPAAADAPSRDDIVVAAAGQGLRRHLGTLLQGLGVAPRLVVDTAGLDAMDGCGLLLVDAPLLAALDERTAWLERQAACGRQVVVLWPLGGAPLGLELPGVQRLHKPVRPAALAALLGSAPSCTPAGGLVPGKVSRPRLLLCEDNPVNQVVLKAMLAQSGVLVTLAHDGLEALERLSLERFDCVLMDLDLPGLDGASAAREWRRLEALGGFGRTPIVAISASTEGMADEHLVRCGIDDALAKPFSLTALQACLGAWLPSISTSST